MWPKKPSRVPGRRHTSRTWRAISRAGTAGAGVHVPRGPFRTTARVSAAASMLAAAAAAERGRPAERVQQGEERHGRQDLPDLTEDAGQLRDQRDAAGGEPAGDEPQDRHEHHGVARAHHDAGQHHERQGRRERQQQLPAGEQGAAQHQHGARAPAVHQEAARQLGRDVDRDLEEDERRQRGRADPEAVRGIESGDAERRALHDGQDVPEHADGPDEGRPRRQPCLRRSRCSLRSPPSGGPAVPSERVARPSMANVCQSCQHRRRCPGSRRSAGARRRRSRRAAAGDAARRRPGGGRRRLDRVARAVRSRSASTCGRGSTCRRSPGEMGYRPNRLAQALPTGRTRMLAVLVPDITNPHNFGLVRGAEAQARAAGSTLVIADTQAGPELEPAHLDRLASSVDGFVLAASRLPDAELQTLAGRSPVVLFNRRVDGLASLVTDSADGSRQIVEHLVALGHRSLAYLAGPSDNWSDAERWRALSEHAEAAGATIVRCGPFAPTLDGGPAAADVGLATGATALVAFNDLLAIGVLRRLARAGRRRAGAGQRGRVRRHLRRRLLLPAADDRRRPGGRGRARARRRPAGGARARAGAHAAHAPARPGLDRAAARVRSEGVTRVPCRSLRRRCSIGETVHDPREEPRWQQRTTTRACGSSASTSACSGRWPTCPCAAWPI